MKTTIKIVGCGKQFIGKKNPERTYQNISFLYDDPRFTGERAVTALVNDLELDGYFPKVGDQVLAFIDEDYQSGRVRLIGIIG